MKYANNTFDDMVNSKSRVIYVNGFRHIGLFATKKIESGEEILFDYGYPAQKQLEIEWMS